LNTISIFKYKATNLMKIAVAGTGYVGISNALLFSKSITSGCIWTFVAAKVELLNKKAVTYLKIERYRTLSL